MVVHGADFWGTDKSLRVARQVAAVDQKRILRLAGAALTRNPPAITDQVATNSTGGVHDFFSQADYAWPDTNPTNRTGRPYITRDGFVNPDLFNAHRVAMLDMRDAVTALAAAYALTGDDQYATKAADYLRVFFLDERTRMNPNLAHAQAVLGVSSGSSFGIIDSLNLTEVPLAVRILERSPAFPAEVDRGLKQWFTDYSKWITTAPPGRGEMNSANNHGAACFVQLASYAKFTGDGPLLELARRQFLQVLFPNQMTSNGSFPMELARSRPYHYSIFQADNMSALCVLLSSPQEDFWRYMLPDGRTPRDMVDFIFPYLEDKRWWLKDHRGKDVVYWDRFPLREPCLLFAYARFGDEKYFKLWKAEDAALNDSPDMEIRRSEVVSQPLLWVATPEMVPLLKPAGK